MLAKNLKQMLKEVPDNAEILIQDGVGEFIKPIHNTGIPRGLCRGGFFVCHVSRCHVGLQFWACQRRKFSKTIDFSRKSGILY